MAHVAKKHISDVPAFLLEAYNSLRHSDLVLRRDIDKTPSKDAMKKFAWILNRTVPKDEYTRGKRAMVLTLVYITEGTNQMVLMINDKRYDMTPYILWTSGQLIAAHFGLDNYVTISFNKHKNVYSVMDRNAPRQAPKYPPQHKKTNARVTEFLDEDEECDEKEPEVANGGPSARSIMEAMPIGQDEFNKLIQQIQANRVAAAASLAEAPPDGPVEVNAEATTADA